MNNTKKSNEPAIFRSKIRPVPRGMVLENTFGKAVASPTVSGVSFRPKFGGAGIPVPEVADGMGLPVRMAARLYPCFQHPVHPLRLKTRRVGFQTRKGVESMPSKEGTHAHSTPTKGNTPTITPIEALRAILAELEPPPGHRRFTGDSYLPHHIVELAKAALTQNDEAVALHQVAHNALSMASWHIARGETGRAMSRIRRAQTHLGRSFSAAELRDGHGNGQGGAQ